MGACLREGCRSFIVALNTLVLLCSLGVLAVSIYAIVEYYKGTFDVNGFEEWMIWVPFAVSLFLAIVAIVGCCTTMADAKCCIAFYAILQFVFGIVIIVAGAILVVYIGYLGTIATTPVTELKPGVGNTQQYLSDYTTGLFKTCCDAVTMIVQPCSQLTTNDIYDYCYFDENVYNTGVNTPQADCQAAIDTFENELDTQMCLDLTIVAPGRALKNFQSGAHEYLNAYWLPAGIAFCVFGSLIFLAFFGSAYLGCCASDPKKENQSAGATAGTTQKSGAPMTMA